MLRHLARIFRRTQAADPPAPQAARPPQTFASDLRSAGVAADDWVDTRKQRRAMYSTPGPGVPAALRTEFPQRVDATIAAAERILRHEFDLLGSGPYVPADPDRPCRDGYTPIDWYLDPVRNLRFPRGIPHKSWNLQEMRPGNADVKYPWELGRCQHWPVLGQAFLLTGDDRFALEIARQLDDFMEANPTGIGVNWTCTMDVGIRAANWAIALEMIHECPSIGQIFWLRAYEALFDHGVFIRNNLENTYEVTSNHFLSNLLGLQFAGAVLDGLPQAAEWSAFARSSIEREMDVQVLADGADYESSIPYHRLVTELFLAAARLGDHAGVPFTTGYKKRLADMVAFLAAVTRPDGLMPQVGDADDGRLHVLGGYSSATPQDPRHLFGPAAVMFERDDWQRLGGDAGAWEAAWWGLPNGPIRSASTDSKGARSFPDAGIAVARNHAGSYLLVTNGIVGTNGFGNHKHNDQLSFEYHRDGVPLIVDVGSYVYTCDPGARNRFRATASHNTVLIDDVEQNELRPDWLFRLFETARAEAVAFSETADIVEYTGRHHGYERVPEPVTHERTFRFMRQSGDVAIIDRLAGRGRHDLSWHFHFAPGVAAAASGPDVVTLDAAGRRWRLRIPGDLHARIESSAYSPSYGVRVPIASLALSSSAQLDGDRTWQFAITS